MTESEKTADKLLKDHCTDVEKIVKEIDKKKKGVKLEKQY